MGYRHYIGIIKKDKLESITSEFDKVKIKYMDIPKDERDNEEYEKRTTYYIQSAIKDACHKEFELGKLYYSDTDDVYELLYKNLITNYMEFDKECAENECFKMDRKVIFEMANLYIDKGKSAMKDSLKNIEKFRMLIIRYANKKNRKSKTRITIDIKSAKILNELLCDLNYECDTLRHFDIEQKDLELNWMYKYQAFYLMHLHLTLEDDDEVVCYAH